MSGFHAYFDAKTPLKCIKFADIGKNGNVNLYSINEA